jgi:hypothetical protein
MTPFQYSIIVGVVFWAITGALLVDCVGSKIVRRGKLWEQLCLTLFAGPIVWLLMLVILVARRVWRSRNL